MKLEIYHTNSNSQNQLFEFLWKHNSRNICNAVHLMSGSYNFNTNYMLQNMDCFPCQKILPLNRKLLTYFARSKFNTFFQYSRSNLLATHMERLITLATIMNYRQQSDVLYMLYYCCCSYICTYASESATIWGRVSETCKSCISYLKA